MSLRKIGVGISTHNRYEIFKDSLDRLLKVLPENTELFIVDDGSQKRVPEATKRNEAGKGIAEVKNQCLKALKDCSDIFLFDDDCYPLKEDWWKPYVESDYPHLMYLYETQRKFNNCYEIERNDGIKSFNAPRGCMLYYKREVLNTVGGMNPKFGKWGGEHREHSLRIFKYYKYKHPYNDVVASEKLIFSKDEHIKGLEKSTSIQERIAKYKEILSLTKDSVQFYKHEII